MCIVSIDSIDTLKTMVNQSFHFDVCIPVRTYIIEESDEDEDEEVEETEEKEDSEEEMQTVVERQLPTVKTQSIGKAAKVTKPK